MKPPAIDDTSTPVERLLVGQPLRRRRFPDGHQGWLVTGHALARRVLTDSRFAVMSGGTLVGDPKKFSELRDDLERFNLRVANLLALDPPIHTRYRRIVAPRFTARGVQGFEDQLHRIVTEQLDAMERSGSPADLMASFALPVSLRMHCVLLGVPPEDSDLFAPISGSFLFTASADEIRSLLQELVDYLSHLIDAKRAAPAEDLTSDIVRQEDLRDDEIASLAFNILTAGRGSSEDALTLAVYTLLTHPEELDALRRGRVALDAAVEELLRYISMASVPIIRTAITDIELGGVAIRAGDRVAVSQASANRDPDRFVNPNALDLTRSATGQLAFGQGAHICLGQHLARLELRVALGALFARFPTLHLAGPAVRTQLHGNAEQLQRYELLVGW